jgi:hypothetical protein
MGAHALDLAPFWLLLVAGFAAGTATWIVAADYGTAIVSRWIHFAHPAARIGVGAATGYALIGSAMALLGLAGAVHPLTLWSLLVAAIAIRVPHVLRRVRALTDAWVQARAALARAHIVGGFALALIACAVLTGLANAALPAVWWDPIAYHLPIARAALLHGGFAFDPLMVQSGFPLLGEAAALPAYTIAGSAGASMTTLGAGLCIGLLVWALADGICAGSGIVAAMLATSSALWAWLAPSFYVDVPFAMFVLAAIVAVLELPIANIGRMNSTAPEARTIRQANSTAPQAPAVALLAGALCGAAAAIKYSGLGATVIVLALALWIAGPKRAKVVGGFLTGFVLVAAGWYIRSLVATGDPLYPFLSGALAHASSVRDFSVRYVDMTRHWCGGGTSLTDLITLPYRLVAEPKGFCGDPGPALQVGLVVAGAALLVMRQARVVATVAIALALLWFASSQQWRFLLPAVFLYAAIVAAGTSAAGERMRLISAVTLVALGAIGVVSDWIPLARSEASASLAPAFAYMSGRQSAADYLDARLETFAAARWCADRRIPGQQIIALDDVRDYYFPPGTAWANPYYQPALAIDWGAPSTARYQKLAASGFKYFVVNENSAYLHRTPTGIDWPAFAVDKRDKLRELFSANDVYVFELRGTR